jgi:hypothetical protein
VDNFGDVPSSVYIETSIVSYLAARSSSDIVVAAHQRLTQRWWQERRSLCLTVHF